MGESDRKILIDIEANYDQVKRAASEIEKLEKEKVTVQCIVDVDGKKAKSDIQGILNKIEKDGLKQKVTLELNTSALSKEMKKAEVLAKKSAQQIANEFERATTSRAPSTLRSVLNNKKTFSKTNEQAIKELIAYRNAAVEKVKDVEFDFSDATIAMDEDRIHRYGKALNELAAVLRDVNEVSTAKGLSIPALTDGTDIDGTLRKLEELKKASTSLINSFGKNQMENISSTLESVAKEFMHLPEKFGKDVMSGVVTEAQSVGQAVSKATDEIKELQQTAGKTVTIDANGTESQDLSSLATMLDTVIKKVNEKTAAFRTEAATVNGVADNEVAALSKVLSIVEKIADSAGKLPASLKNLQGINFEGLGNLKYSGKAVDVLTKQSKQFLNTQNKQIDTDLKRYRKAGLSEENLRPLKEAKELLNSSFTASGMLDMSDVTGEMSAFVSMLSEAENKCDSIAASLKAASDATATAESSVSKYSTLLNKEKTLLNKRLKNGSWTPMEKYDYDRIVAERREIERKYANDEKFQETQLPYRKAVYKTAKKEYSDFLKDVYNKAKDVVDKEPDIINTDKLDEAKIKFNEISELRDKLAKNDFLDDDDIKEARELSNSIDNIIKSLQYKTTSKGSYIGSLGDVNNIEEAIEKTRELIRLRAEEKKSKINFVDLSHDDATKGAITYDEITNDGTIKRQVANLNLLDKSIRNTTKSETEYVSQGQKFINSIKGKFAELTRYMSVMDVIRGTLNFIKDGIRAVVDINTAMTELKKVTDETSESYSTFQKTAGNVAVTVGSTTKDIISSTADFSRLGYDLNQSSELAKNTAIYKNVGDGIDIDTATEDIVSITKAYNIAAEESMHVIDVLNEVGNKYAISSSGIGAGLKRSSSALAAGNNTFEESVAMLTAMNEVLQDSALSGTTLKMLSLRLRGAKTEIEEMGEDTAGMAESTSKLREQILALTNVNGKGGFDIMTADGKAFKSTYEILQGISKVWKDISDIDQANIYCLYVQKCA